MFESEALKQMGRRKEALIARCELQRQMLRLDGGLLADSLSGLDRGLGGVWQNRYLWAGAAPVGGFLLLRRWRFFFRLARRLAFGWAMVRKGRRLFQQVSRVMNLQAALKKKMGL
jgi:hypothetical protein